MTIIQIISTLIVLTGAFGVVNYLFLKLPSTIGILIVALLASISVMSLDYIQPEIGISQNIITFINNIEFSETLLEGMLGLLLFAGALHIKIADLKLQIFPILLMATIGVATSTIIIGFGFSWFTGIPLIFALIFGALISPTDPVAVIGILKQANLSKSLETKIAGESLFNDGVGYVLFLLLIGLAFSTDHHTNPTTLNILILFLSEVVGGALLGAILGYLTFCIMKRIDDYSLEVLLTLGLALGGYQLAIFLHVSGPIMVVVAGLFIGHVGLEKGMSELTREYINSFWQLIDEILNAVLFLLIGFKVLSIVFSMNVMIIGLFAIILCLIARFSSVLVPIILLKPFRDFSKGVVPIMTWGGLKGGISVALALSLPENEWKSIILTSTYMVVLFSIIIQGLTIAPLAKFIGKKPKLK
jgi:CPA1 family monovalent cation:H+ antiporter